MNSNAKAMAAHFSWAIIVGTALATTASAEISVTAHNIMVDPVTIYVRSTSLNRRATTRHSFRADQTKTITLKGNDPFLITGIDSNRNRFDSAPVNIQANVLSNPSYVLEIGGAFAQRVLRCRYWSRRYRRWIYDERIVTGPNELILRLVDPTGKSPPIDVGTGSRRR